MAQLPYLSTVVTDHLAQTAHLSAEAMGAYEILRCHYWLRQGPLPAEPDELARLVRMTPAAWRRVSAKVLAFFVLTDLGYRNEQLETALEDARHRSQKARESVAHRWNGRNTKTPAERIRTYDERKPGESTKGERSQYSPSPSSSPPPKGEGEDGDPSYSLVETFVENSVDNSMPFPGLEPLQSAAEEATP